MRFALLLLALTFGLIAFGLAQAKTPVEQSNASAMMKLTRPDHRPVWINRSQVAGVSPVVKGDGGSGKTRIVFVSGQAQCVIETPEAVMHAWMQTDDYHEAY